MISTDFSSSQLEFLSILEILGTPVPLDLACHLSPLPVSELMRLTQPREGADTVEIWPNDLISLSPELDPAFRNNLKKFNTRARVSRMVELLENNPSLSRQLEPDLWAALLARAGKNKEAAFVEHEIASSALRNGDNQKSLHYFDRAVDKLQAHLGTPASDRLFVTASLELSHLRFRSGQRVGELMGLLKKSRQAAERLGDLRSLILIELHMGRHVIMEDQPGEGIQFLTSGLEKARQLGDKDILSRSEEFLGLYYYIHGCFREAVEHFETALQRAEMAAGRPTDFLVPQWLSFSALYRGQALYAKSLISSHLQRALATSETALAEDFRATLGLILLMIGDRPGAKHYLLEARKKSEAVQNDIGKLHAQLGLAYCRFREGQPEEAYRMTIEGVEQGLSAGVLLKQYTWPWFLEMLYKFNLLGYPPISGFDLSREMGRLLDGPNLQLKGVVLRLRAQDRARSEPDSPKVWNDLVASETVLKQSGSTIEIAKTWAEMARQLARGQDLQSAARFASLAWERLSGFHERLFPPDLRPFLDSPHPELSEPKPPEDLMDRFLDLMEGLPPIPEEDSFLRGLLRKTGEFFGVERGAVFLIDGRAAKANWVARATHNLTREEMNVEEFFFCQEMIEKTIRNWKPLVVLPNPDQTGGEGGGETVICLPIEIGSRRYCLFLHDPSEPDQSFADLDESRFDRLLRQLCAYIEKIWDYSKLLEEKGLLDKKTSFLDGLSDQPELIAENAKMKSFLAQSDRVADSEATILITGETGVGKELLARRIHKMHPRRGKGPFVAFDLASVPETLLESELFGHEKGAFSGALRMKLGRMELADGGTLFIDEVGDIPLGIQVKLLRAIQEKSFFRVGGTQTLTPDFRLVAATNRDLKELVVEGKFREDLFYRLNVIPLEMPPLRKRGRDIVVVARHFLEQYMNKYKRRGLEISREAERDLRAYSWPGNVRELKHVIERSVLLSSDGRLELEITRGNDRRRPDVFSDQPSLDELQRRYIRHVLDLTGGKIGGSGGAAEILQLKRTTLNARLKKLGLA